jgi:hypothetical protein
MSFDASAVRPAKRTGVDVERCIGVSVSLSVSVGDSVDDGQGDGIA